MRLDLMPDTPFDLYLISYWACEKGDLMFAYKAALALSQAFPAARLTWMTNAVELASRLIETPLLQARLCPPGPIVRKELPAVALQVPALNTPLGRAASVDVPIAYVHEYGGRILDRFAQQGDWDTGFHPSSIGFFVDEELRLDSRLSPSERLAKLHTFSVRAFVEEILLGRAIESYQSSAKLYLAYASKAMPLTFYEYLRVLCEAEKEDGRDLDLCVVGRASSLGSYLFRCSGPRLAELGVARMLIYSAEGLQAVPLSAEGKTLRVFCLPFLPHSDFKTLMTASEPFVCVTGDQSLSEAISAGKLYMYEQMEHKYLSFQQLVQQAQAIAPPVGRFLKGSSDFLPWSSQRSDWSYLKEGTIPPRFDSRPYEELGADVRAGALEAAFRTFNDFLCEKRSLAARLVLLVQDCLQLAEAQGPARR